MYTKEIIYKFIAIVSSILLFLSAGLNLAEYVRLESYRRQLIEVRTSLERSRDQQRIITETISGIESSTNRTNDALRGAQDAASGLSEQIRILKEYVTEMEVRLYLYNHSVNGTSNNETYTVEEDKE